MKVMRCDCVRQNQGTGEGGRGGAGGSTERRRDEKKWKDMKENDRECARGRSEEEYGGS